MSRLQSIDEVYSVLYVDFDNIYTRLFELDPNLARTFATNPQRWMRWLEGHALRMMYGEGVRRRILKRICYLNPLKYHEFRPYFIRSAFQVVDCPPLTNYGKTSADIHLVMDCMDALSHTTRFDEFIILSGDADFTPLLLRIQEHARRSLVLSVGFTSPAYTAACSWRIREDWFLSQALEDQRGDEDEKGVEKQPENRPSGNGFSHSRPAPHERDHNGNSGSKTGIQLPAYKRIHLIETIRQLAEESQVPVPLPSISQVLQSEQGATADWYGAGTLRDLLEKLDLSPVIFTPVGQGFIYDPDRHTPPAGNNVEEVFRKKNPALYEFAVKVHRLTELPLLSPPQYASLLSLLIDEIHAHGFSRTGTARALEEHCRAEGIAVTLAQVGAVIEGIIRGGARLSANGKGGSSPSIESVRTALGKNAVELCKIAQIPLDDDALDMLDEWLESEEI